MSISQLFDWPTAKAALNSRWRVRRAGWTDRWLERWTGGLIWLILTDGSKRVVKNTDFGAEEFTALDWTNLPLECVTEGTTAGSGTNGCPLPFTPSTGGTQGKSSGGNDPEKPLPLPPDQPPVGGGGAGQTGSGGGGNLPPRPDQSQKEWPALSLSMSDNQNLCYQSINGQQFVYPNMTGTVSLSGGDPGLFAVSVMNGSNTVFTVDMSAGNSVDFTWDDPSPVIPGNSLGFSARAWAQGAPDIQTSASASIKPWCNSLTITVDGTWDDFWVVKIDGAIRFQSAISGGYQQQSSVTIPDVPPGSLVELYVHNRMTLDTEEDRRQNPWNGTGWSYRWNAESGTAGGSISGATEYPGDTWHANGSVTLPSAS